jgi:hypothetical protein
MGISCFFSELILTLLGKSLCKCRAVIRCRLSRRYFWPIFGVFDFRHPTPVEHLLQNAVRLIWVLQNAIRGHLLGRINGQFVCEMRLAVYGTSLA